MTYPIIVVLPKMSDIPLEGAGWDLWYDACCFWPGYYLWSLYAINLYPQFCVKLFKAPSVSMCYEKEASRYSPQLYNK